MAGVADTFRGLPMEDLIAAPLKAVCDSQKQLAKSTHEFMMQIGFDTDDKGNLAGPRLLEYQLERPVNDGTMAKVVVKAPLLTLVPIPTLHKQPDGQISDSCKCPSATTHRGT